MINILLGRFIDILFLSIIVVNINMKSKFTLWSVVLLLAGFIFVGCDNERTENASDFQTGIHKIVIQQSGDTDSFEVSVSIGGADKGGPAKLYNDKENTLVIPILPK